MITEQEQIWRQLPPPDLTSPVYALAVDRNKLWAGGVGGIASCSPADAQCVWQPGAADLPLSSVTALLAQDEVLLAGGSEGIAYSFNGGQDWRQARLEHGLAAIMALVASPNFMNDRTALAATLENGLLRTRDGGRTWFDASFGLEGLDVSALFWSEDDTLLAATSDGIYRSRDAGRAWRRIYASDSGEKMVVEALTILPGGTLLAALESGVILLSRDNGQNWSERKPGPQASPLALCSASSGTLLLGTTDGLFRSDDAGENWQKVYEKEVQVCAQDATWLYAGHAKGVGISSDDGRTWSELPSPPLYDLRTMLASADRVWLASTYSGIVSATPTTGWQLLENTVLMALTACKLFSEDALLISSPAGLTRLSLVDGTQQNLLAGEEGHIAQIALRKVDENYSIWMAKADGTGLLRSTDGGATWHALSVPFGILPLVALEVIAGRLLAATYDPRLYHVCIWYSLDDGQTWERSIEANTRWPLVATCAQPAAVSIGNILFLENAAGQWHSVDIGQGGAIRRIQSLRLEDKTALYVLTTTGILYTEDLGATWRQENDGLPVEHIVDLAIAGSTLSVLLTGGRVWQRDLREA